MSETYNIACIDCREFIWVGQKTWIYKNERHLDVLEKFLFVHLEHELKFLGLDALNAYTDWKEIVVAEEDGSYDLDSSDEDRIRFDEWLTKKQAGISIR